MTLLVLMQQVQCVPLLWEEMNEYESHSDVYYQRNLLEELQVKPDRVREATDAQKEGRRDAVVQGGYEQHVGPDDGQLVVVSGVRAEEGIHFLAKVALHFLLLADLQREVILIGLKSLDLIEGHG